VVLPTAPLPNFYDAAAVNPDARATAIAAATSAPPRPVADMEGEYALLPYMLLVLEWPQVQGAARRALRSMLATVHTEVTAGPRQTVQALQVLRSIVMLLREGGRSLTALVETQRVCAALTAVSRAMIAHIADEGVQLVGVAALCAIGVWPARPVQRALAAALAAHTGSADAVAVLAAAAARYTRARLSSDADARAIGVHLAAALTVHAANDAVAPAVVKALRNTLVHLTLEERYAVDAGGATRVALETARVAAAARGDADCVDAARAVEAVLAEAVAANVAAVNAAAARAQTNAAPVASEAHMQGDAAPQRNMVRTRAQRAMQRDGVNTAAAVGLTAEDEDEADSATAGAQRRVRARIATVAAA
jgi:hypothetical protein